MRPRDILARTLQAEAGNQGRQGMLDVGAVIDNRLKSGRWGNTLYDVIMAPGQFSAWNSVTGYAGGEQGQDMGFTPSKAAYEAADTILSGDYPSRVGDALNYFAIIPGVSDAPSWADDSFVKYGDHYFGTAGGGSMNERTSPTMQLASASSRRADELMLALIEGAGSTEGEAGQRTLQFPANVQSSRSEPYTMPPTDIQFRFPQQPTAQAQPQPTPQGDAAATPFRLNEAGAPVDMGGGGQPETFAQRVANAIFPNDPENAYQRTQNLMAGLSESLGNLGNITGGAQVSAAPMETIGRIAKQKETAAASAMELFKQQLEARRVAVQEGNLAVNEARNLREQALFEQDATGQGRAFTPDQIEQLRLNPSTGYLAEGLMSRDPVTRRAAEGRAYDVLGDMFKQASTPQMGSAWDAGVTYTDNPTAENRAKYVEALDNLPPEDAARVMTAPGIKLPERDALARQLVKLPEGSPERAALEQVINASGGIEATVDTNNLNRGTSIYRTLSDKAEAARRLEPDLSRISDINKELFRAEGEGAETGENTKWFASAQKFAAGLGFSSVDEFLAENVTGATAEQLEGLDQATKWLLFELGKEKVKGQGSISDSEREDMARMLLSPNVSPHQWTYVLSRLEAAGVYDKMSSDIFNDLTQDDQFYSNVHSAERELDTIRSGLEGSLTAAFKSQYMIEVAYQTGDQDTIDLVQRASAGDLVAKRAFYRRIAPELTRDQARYAEKYLAERNISHYIDTESKELIDIRTGKPVPRGD